MKRRAFIAGLGSAAAWLVVARAQTAIPVIGYLHNGFPEPHAHLVAAFREGLRESGFIEGENVAIEFRWAEGQPARLPGLVAELIQLRVVVIATPLSTQAAVAASSATRTIPIVFGTGGDPVALGLVASFNKPGGNATGISFMTAGIGAKLVGLLHELVPKATRFAMLVNPNSALTKGFLDDVQTAAGELRLHIQILHAGDGHAINAAFESLIANPTEALLTAPDELFTSKRVQLAGLAVRHSIPMVSVTREYAEAGGLMSYGPNLANAYRQIGIYTARILKGEKPANLPVMQPAQFELVINVQTAQTLGIEIPPQLLARADKVIE
jgi:putative ABC transport system substrate-binding protein